MNPFSTVVEAPPAHLPTGNLEVHLETSPMAPSILQAGVVSTSLNGLLDLVGAPLMEVSGGDWTLSRLAQWVPIWQNSQLKVTLLAPYAQRGFVLRLEPLAGGPVQVSGSFEYLGLRRLREEELLTGFRTRHDPQTGGYTLEANAERTLLALGIQVDREPTRADWGSQYVLEWDSGPVTIYVALAPEADGARTTALHMKQLGWDALLHQTLYKLEQLTANYNGPLPEVYQRHLLFSYFYAQADSLEGRPVLLSSKSLHASASGVFRARDGLLHFFPALLRADRRRARVVLRSVLDHYARWAGQHTQYLSGPPLYPGFELDEAAAYPLALARYLEATGPQPELVAHYRELMEDIMARVQEERHPTLPLFRTHRSPSDHSVPHPYLTYDNALWCVALDRLSVFWHHRETLKGETRSILETLLRQAERGGRYTFSFEPGTVSGYTYADDPAGSLILLPYYGFCSRQDALWQATALWILGEDNPNSYRGRFIGEGTGETPLPSGYSLGNRILAGLLRPSADALMVLEQAPLDMGYTSELFDPQTGFARAGCGAASLAGFIANALAASKESRLI